MGCLSNGLFDIQLMVSVRRSNEPSRRLTPHGAAEVGSLISGKFSRRRENSIGLEASINFRWDMWSAFIVGFDWISSSLLCRPCALTAAELSATNPPQILLVLLRASQHFFPRLNETFTSICSHDYFNKLNKFAFRYSSCYYVMY